MTRAELFYFGFSFILLKTRHFPGFWAIVCGLQQKFCRKNLNVIDSYIHKGIGMIRCEKNDIFILHFN